MLGKATRRATEILVLFFALYAFAFVPLGSKTGLEHVKAIFSTGPAKEAAAEAIAAGRRLVERVKGSQEQDAPAQTRVVPAADAGAGLPDASADYRP